MSSDDIVPEDVRSFLLSQIDSIAQLETLLLTRREPQVCWTAKNLSARLYVSAGEAAAVLARLAERGLLIGSAGGGYSYAVGDGELAHVIERLASLYGRHLIPITNLIHSKPRRIREFADAFMVKKDS